jgi:hypothetical protein
MKALIYIGILTALVASSCASGRISTGESDDLYYSSSDKGATAVTSKTKSKDGAATTKPDQYFDNIYAQDTLIADGYNDAVDFNSSTFYQNNNNGAFEYMDDPFSYSHRLSMFYGSTLYPYWRDPFYGYSPYYYDYYSPYYSPYYGYGYGYGYGMSPYFYGGYYGGYYGGFYGGFGISFGFGSGGYYGGIGYSTGIGYYSPYTTYPSESAPATGRRERYSTLSTSYTTVTPSRKSTYSTSATDGSARRVQGTSQSASGQEYRRMGTGTSTVSQNRTTTGQGTRATNSSARRDVSEMTQPASRPEYNSAERSYTPSYNNPRMSERPSYNNSRMSGSSSNQGAYQGTARTPNSIGSYRSNSDGNIPGRSSSSFSTGQIRSGSINSGNSGSYSVPSRRDYSGGGSEYSSGRSIGGSNYSGGSSSVRSSGGGSSYSGGSSGGSSYSGGGSSNGGGGRSSGTASGTRR